MPYFVPSHYYSSLPDFDIAGYTEGGTRCLLYIELIGTHGRV